MIFGTRFPAEPLIRSLFLRGAKARFGLRSTASPMVLAVLLASLVAPGAAQKSLNRDGPTRSTTIALTSDETRVVVVNREANSVSIIRVKDANGNDVANKLAEIGVGEEPRCVAVHPTDRVAYVTNGISGTVSVVDLVLGRVVQRDHGAPSRGAAP